jgi:hypothetical protein
MKCRHCNAAWDVEWEYCPQCQRNFGGAVYPEKQTPEELRDIAALAEMIEQAFAGVRLEGGTTIHEAKLEGAYTDDQDRLDARAKDPETDWMDIPEWKLERFSAPLSFFDPIGWRFHIPAYMRWTLRNWRTSDSQTVDSTIWNFNPFGEWSIERYRTLTSQQGKAVFAFLDFFRKYSGEPDADRAIAAYWYRFET